MYVLPQARLISNELFTKRLAKYVFKTKHTLGLWHHKSFSIKFSLFVEIFGI